MATFHLNSLPKRQRVQLIGEFYDTIHSLKDREEVRLFFKSLLTADEIAALMRRIEIAVLLFTDFTYDEIIEILRVGRAKVSSVHKNLLQDDNGYKIIAQRLLEDRKNRLRKLKKDQRERLSSMGFIRKKYKAHFLLNNILDTAISRLGEDTKKLEKEAALFTPSSNL